MAGMFYSLEEAAEKLNKTKEELKQIVQEGKLREFRDGPNLLFKVEEVEALMSDLGDVEPDVIPQAEPEAPEPEISAPDISELEAPEPEMPELEALEPEEASEPELPELEALESEDASEPELPELEALVPEEASEPEKAAEPEEVPEPEIPSLEATDIEAPESLPEEEDMDLDEILLAPETGTPVLSDDLTDADTALTGQGTNVLGQTDRDYEITDDTMADTVIPAGKSSEVPLEQIEEDVNLDSFGSGSGLLDLSLQADDTSLGGILDEIYTADGEAPEAGEVEPVPVADSEAAIGADADQMVPEEELAAPVPAQEVPALATTQLIEAAPDKQSNLLGMMLFIPLLAVIYTIVVAVAGMRDVMPSILDSIQDFIWYIVAAAIVTSGLIAGISFMTGGERTKKAKTPKAKKEKKPKKEKVKKEKKKKEKKPKKGKKK
jgi:excisionase family DNA binding protein